jgi:hypothetical protein
MESPTDWLATVALIAVVSHAAVGCWLTWKLVRSDDVDLHRKRAQIALVWLIPVLGAIAVHWFIFHGTASVTPADRGHIPQRPNHYGAGQYDR